VSRDINGTRATGDRRAQATAQSVVPALILLVVATYLFSSGEDLSLLSYTAIFALVGYAVAISFRYAGILMVAQGVVWGAGTYLTSLLVGRYNWTTWEVAPLAVVAGAVLAVVIGAVSMRSRGHYFLIVTFAMNELVVYLAGTSNYLGGTNGLILLQRPSAIASFTFDTPLRRYYLYVVFLLIGMAVCVVIGRSRFGRRLVAMRENEDLARSMGISLIASRLQILAVGGALAGIAGVLYAYQQPAVTPTLFSAVGFLPVVAMVIIGGRDFTFGPLLGAFLLEFLPSWLNFSPLVSQLIYGLILVVAILVIPEGLAGVVVRGTPLLRSARRLLSRGSGQPPPSAEPSMAGDISAGSARVAEREGA
jgi:branched-chain amino acid transport system permease protein